MKILKMSGLTCPEKLNESIEKSEAQLVSSRRLLRPEQGKNMYNAANYIVASPFYYELAERAESCLGSAKIRQCRQR